MSLPDWLKNLLDQIRALFSPPPAPPPVEGPLVRRVLAITFAPLIPSAGNRPLYEAVPGWHQPDALLDALIADLRADSSGLVNYVIAEKTVVSDFTPMTGGKKYTPQQYLAVLSNQAPPIDPDRCDYAAVLAQFDVLAKVKSGAIDEVWLMGYPYAGFRESRMGGPRAFFCNGEVLENTSASGRRFVVMGFNYERGVGEMLESYAHRCESILDQAFASISDSANLWERFKRIDVYFPGQAEVGTVHHAPNAVPTPQRDHQWEETRLVPSRHRTWYSFPNLDGLPEWINCDAWRDADMTRGHHNWWLRHFPHAPGQTDGVSNNWWLLVADPQNVRA